MNNNKGITLVALVVTIIVLIILAGISINLILGDNGIITIAKKAKENIELAKIEEETELNELYTQLETEGSSSGNLPYDSIAKLTEFKTAIANAIDKAGGIKPEITAETSVFADNINGIVKEVTKDATATADNISEGKTAWVNGKLITGTAKNSNVYYLGTGTSFNVSSISGFENFDSSNFIVGGISAPDMKTSRYTTGAGNVEDRAAARGFTINKTYDKTTGILSLSGTSQTIQIHKNSNGYSSWASDQQNINCFAYLVLGNIQNIP